MWKTVKMRKADKKVFGRSSLFFFWLACSLGLLISGANHRTYGAIGRLYLGGKVFGLCGVFMACGGIWGFWIFGRAAKLLCAVAEANPILWVDEEDQVQAPPSYLVEAVKGHFASQRLENILRLVWQVPELVRFFQLPKKQLKLLLSTLLLTKSWPVKFELVSLRLNQLPIP